MNQLISTGILLLFFSCQVFCQKVNINNLGTSRAVIVGISDYQDPKIPDLKYADKDAELFAGYLKSSSGGNLSDEHIYLLTNEKATVAQIGAALTWLVEESEKGDKAIIYFSCHGDAENQTMFQLGYLLAWDSPPNVYGAGAIPINFLQAIISTLSIQKESQVLVFSDACRAGKLAGSAIGGTQIANGNLMKQFGYETKILSCQPNEFSVEGEQWGQGSGVFTHHLIEGLYGLADSDQNMDVSLLEIENYLENKVPPETAPHSQIPMTTGNKSIVISKVDEDVILRIEDDKESNLPRLKSVESKALENLLFENMDSSRYKIFVGYKSAIDEGNFLTPKGSSANDFFNQIMEDDEFKAVRGYLKRNFAAALQDESQQVINRILKSDPEEHEKLSIVARKEYQLFPQYLRRAAELLGEEHYMYRILQGRSYWFEGYLERLKQSCNCYDPGLAKKTLPLFLKALDWNAEMPETWSLLAYTYGVNLRMLDSMEYYAQKAVAFAPNWSAFYGWMGNSYLNIGFEHYPLQKSSFQKAKVWMDKGLEKDSNSVALLNDLSYWYQLHGNFEEERKLLQKSLSIDSMARTLHYLGLSYMASGDYLLAEKALSDAVHKDSSLIILPNGLVELYASTGEFENAQNVLKKALQLQEKDPELLAFCYTRLGYGYSNNGYFEEAREAYKEALNVSPHFTDVYYYMVSNYKYLGSPKNLKDMKELLEKTYALDSTNYSVLMDLAMVNLKLGSLETAQKQLTDAKLIASGLYEVYLNLFIVLLDGGKEEMAKRELAKAIEIEQNRADATNVASALKQLFIDWPWLGDPHIYFEKVIEWFPEYGVNYYEYARYLAQNKEIDKAYKNLIKSLEIGFEGSYFVLKTVAFENLRKDKERWNSLIEKYFSDSK